MSSDSEDDCYGNVAQRLQTVKSAFLYEKIDSTNMLIQLQEKRTPDQTWRKIGLKTLDTDCDVSHKSGIGDEITLDAIIAKNSKKRATSAAKRPATEESTSDITTGNTPSKRATRAKKISKATSITSQGTPEASGSSDIANGSEPSSHFGHIAKDSELDESLSSRVRGSGRGRGRGRPKTPQRARGRRQTSTHESPNLDASCSRPRGRGRRRGRSRRSWAMEDNPLLFDFMAAIAESLAYMPRNTNHNAANNTVYSVGNTDEYPDQCDNQPLFSSAPTPQTQSNVVVVENDLEDDEELSLKVYWQNLEVIKFNLCLHQPLTPIFEHFAEREKVEQDKLLFTYNDKILRSTDTPESINYSIVKFIDGGVTNESLRSVIKDVEDGIKLKFQCQNVKKPFVACIRPDEKMHLVMTKCAAHLDKPLDKLKFIFDGDMISGKSTPQELELEGGECIDVTIS